MVVGHKPPISRGWWSRAHLFHTREPWAGWLGFHRSAET